MRLLIDGTFVFFVLSSLALTLLNAWVHREYGDSEPR